MKKTKHNKEMEEGDLQEKILEILPMIQSDIWKRLKIKRRKCSNLVQKLEKQGLIKRTKVKGVTYMVEKVERKPHIKEKSKDNYSVLLSGSGIFSPCVGCKVMCNPATCGKLDSWVADIA